MSRLFAALILALGLFTAGGAWAAPTPTPGQQAELKRMQALVDGLTPQSGAVPVAGAHVTLNLGEDYYFLDPAESKRVLTEGWGNPPESVQDVIGMVFPAGKSPLDDTWGAVLTYAADGYVSDQDATTIDYAQLLGQLQEGEAQNNEARAAAGFDAMHLVGWAQAPSYDAPRHSLIWAKEISFSGSPDMNTLNYDVRVLGRHGVFSMNLVTDMAHLESARVDATRLMGTASFDDGARYADYQEGKDKKAAYGLAGLVAGGAALAVAKKVGILGILLLVLKKGGVFLLAGLGGAFAWFRNRMSGRKGGEFGDARRAAAPAPIDSTPDPSLAPIRRDEPNPDDPDRPL